VGRFAIALCLILVPFSLRASSGFHALSVKTIDGKEQSLSVYSGKVVLVVNTASECGFTPQYKDLEALYQKFQKQGLVVLGFPSNDFGAQEPGGNAEIKKFCEKKYKTTFPLFEKAVVKGEQKHALYRFLTENSTPKGEVGWNFEKFLLNKKGEPVARFKSSVNPLAPELESAIKTLLTE
jgi:glutathione peroxidase